MHIAGAHNKAGNQEHILIGRLCAGIQAALPAAAVVSLRKDLTTALFKRKPINEQAA